MPSNKEPKDPRSTGRKRGRKVLMDLVKAGELPYECENCGTGPHLYPNVKLYVHHKNKDIVDNDRANLMLVCNNCHVMLDALPVPKDNYGYGI